MQAALASPWIRAATSPAILAATFHLSAGLWTFATLGPRGDAARRRRVAGGFRGGRFSASLSALGIASLNAFRG